MSKESIAPNQIAGWCFLIGQFLSEFEKNKSNIHYKEVNDKFLNSIITNPKLDQFPYLNPSVVLMLCYGLLVYPVGYWEKQPKEFYEKIDEFIISETKNMNFVIKSTFNLFTINVSSSQNIKDLFRCLRHAIAHSNVRFYSMTNTYSFWNIQNEIKSFEVEITTTNLSVFLTGIGKYFINVQRN